MTDKKSKPAEGKAATKESAVTDEQLEGVAGGHKWIPDHRKDPNRKKKGH